MPGNSRPPGVAMTRVADPYELWSDAYPARAHNPLMEAEQAAMLELMPPVAGLTVLDAGCGTGRYAAMLTAAGAARVIALDRSPSMLRAAAPRSRLVRADFVRLPLRDGSVDLVVSGLALPDAPQLEPVLCEWSRVLRPGGAIVCSTLHPIGRDLGWSRTCARHPEADALDAHWHTPDDWARGCRAAALAIEGVREPRLGPRLLRWSQPPVALVVRARRLGRP